MIYIQNDAAMRALGEQLGRQLKGGEVLELIGDVGAGKTTFVKGLGDGLMVDDDVQSPSFTISRVYEARDKLQLHHYDFYRLDDPGVMRYELAESVEDPQSVTVVEWAQTVQSVLPENRCQLVISHTPDGNGRQVEMTVPSEFNYLQEKP